MKINTKITILMVISLLILSATLTCFLGLQLWENGAFSVNQLENLNSENLNDLQFNLNNNRELLLDQKKEYIKSQVQTVMSVLQNAYDDAHNIEKLKAVYHEPLANAVNTAFGILTSLHEAPDLSTSEKQQMALKLIGDLRYGPENKDYFWINDMHPRMIMHPYKPELNGKDVSAVLDPNGKKLFVEFVNTCKTAEQGFVDYYWPKYGSDMPQPKLSFIRLFKPWNWIIGSGVYLEVAEEKLKENAITQIQTLRYGPDKKDYFWINDSQPKMIMHPYKPELNGKILSDIKDTNGKYIFREFVSTCRENNSGFVEYYWPKYGQDQPQPKLSFVKRFEKWNWIVGTGIYIDDVETILLSQKKEIEATVKAKTDHMKTKINTTKAVIHENAKKALLKSGILAFLLLILATLTALFYTRYAVTTPLNRVISGLTEGSTQVNNASTEISVGSHTLAQAASQQAASLAQTTASLKKMSSVTKQNAENAYNADQLIKTTQEILHQSSDAMVQIKDVMQDIIASSKNTSKIINIIDGIAFQTNLLALNAAVEAARAGDKGEGFSIVASEVRNLAVRAAQAAKETDEMIQTTVIKIENGSNMVNTTSQGIIDLSNGSNKIVDLINNIANASDKQASDIENVSHSIMEMNASTQLNAENSVKSATMAEQMKFSAHQMNQCVEDIIGLTGHMKKK